uniref:Uncharacterized protein n=1 Tax=Sphaerodactylus townsendi TaxID=933632 RepID=A0ACB8EF47_9SAUR
MSVNPSYKVIPFPLECYHKGYPPFSNSWEPIPRGLQSGISIPPWETSLPFSFPMTHHDTSDDSQLPHLLHSMRPIHLEIRDATELDLTQPKASPAGQLDTIN